MRSVQLRVPLGVGKRLHDVVFAPGPREHVAFCLVSTVEQAGNTVLLVRHVIELEEGSYIDDASCGAAWRGSAMLPVIEAAMREELGVVLVHAHAFGAPPRLSRPDMETAERMIPMLQRRVPRRPHGSIVLSPGNAGGVIAFPGEQLKSVTASVRWLGTSLIDWPATNRGSGLIDEDVFDRQGLVVGEQGLLARARVAVVGLCGGGSHVVQQLAHSGVGTILGIDGDACERTNGHRDIGMTPSDGQKGTKKIAVMDRLVRSIGNGSSFVGVDARVPEPLALEALKSADVIVGCVDNLHARADLQEIAWRYLIPYIDVGVNIRALKGPAEAPRVVIGGNVYVFIPGGFCAWCCGFVSDDKLADERDGEANRSYFQNKKGEAQVVSFNGVVASAAAGEVLQLLTGYRGESWDPTKLLLPEGTQRGVLKFDGLRGTLQDWGARRREDCPCCETFIGAGSVVWREAS